MVGSFVPALLFGVAFANIFRGIPIDGEGVYQGNLLTLLNPYGLAGGLLFLFLFLLHGSLWLATRSDGELKDRAALTAQRLWPVATILAVLFLVLTAFSTRLYDNYLKNPVLFAVPLITVTALLSMRIFVGKGAWGKAWVASALTIVGATLFGILGLYPNLLPSSLSPAYSLTIHNAASGSLTLTIMLGVALVFVPVVMLYQAWTYRLFRSGPGTDRPEEETY
jgi:cytochrome d ubiquinol oxidase subunit II